MIRCDDFSVCLPLPLVCTLQLWRRRHTGASIFHVLFLNSLWVSWTRLDVFLLHRWSLSSSCWSTLRWSSGFVVTPYSIVSLTHLFFPLSTALSSLIPLIHLSPPPLSLLNFSLPLLAWPIPFCWYSLSFFDFRSSSQDASFLFSYLPCDLYVTQSFPVPRCTYLYVRVCLLV